MRYKLACVGITIMKAAASKGTSAAQKLCEPAGGAGVSWLDELSCCRRVKLFSTRVSVDVVSVDAVSVDAVSVDAVSVDAV